MREALMAPGETIDGDYFMLNRYSGSSVKSDLPPSPGPCETGTRWRERPTGLHHICDKIKLEAFDLGELAINHLAGS